MKQFYFNILLFLPLVTFGQETCQSNGISTNPSNSVNSGAPDANFINAFSWFEATGGVLETIPIEDLNSYYSNSMMLNPYESGNVLTSYLHEVDLADLDVYPEYGWELLSMNLGYYPNGELLSNQIPTEISNNTNLPYILLYNKQRGIMRIFVNIKFVETTSELLGVVMSFDNDHEVSGLLRNYDGYDIALDRETIVTSISSFLNLPSSEEEWTHTDFQVGYDPCTCLFDSRLEFRFIEITSASLILKEETFQTLSIDLMDAGILDQSNGIIPVGSIYPAGTIPPTDAYRNGILVYHSMLEATEYKRVVLEEYISRMNLDGFNTDWLEFQYSVLALLETIAYSEGGAVNATSINDAAIAAANMRLEWGLISSSDIPLKISEFTLDVANCWGILPSDSWSHSSGQYVVNLEKFIRFYLDHMPLPSSFDNFSTVGVESEASFIGLPTSGFEKSKLELQSSFSENYVVDILNPGTYPIQEPGIDVTVQNYPFYNEVLGLFALLRTPKIETWITEENYENTFVDQTEASQTCNNGQLQGPFISERWTYSDESTTQKFRMKEPLQLVFNPAAGIDLENVEINASLNFEVAYSNPSPINHAYHISPGSFAEGSLEASQNASGIYVFAVPNMEWFTKAKSENNLILMEKTASIGGLDQYSYNSPVVTLDALNTMVCEISVNNTQEWYEFLKECVNGAPVNFIDFWQSLDPNFFCGNYPIEDMDETVEILQESSEYNATVLKVYLDLYLKIPFSNPNSESHTYQHVRYKLDTPVPATEDFTAAWSYTENPNEIGTNNLAPIAYFDDKLWTDSDMNTYGGTYLTLPELDPIVKPSALHFIDITGDQTKNSTVNEVVFIAQDHITLYGDLTITDGITLKLEDLVNEIPQTTPDVTNSELAIYCASQTPGSYQANQRSLMTAASNSEPNDEITNLSSIEIYPNPTAESINVRVDSNSGIIGFSIYNSIGIQILSGVNDKRTNSNVLRNIDIRTLSAGSYFIVVETENGKRLSKGFVVTN